MVLDWVLKELGPVTGTNAFSTYQPGAAELPRLSLKLPRSLHCRLKPLSSLQLEEPSCRAPSVFWILEPHLITPEAASYSEI